MVNTIASINQLGVSPYEGMVWIPGGTFLMGSDKHYPEEAPAHEVTVDGFWWMCTHLCHNKSAAQIRSVQTLRKVTVD